MIVEHAMPPPLLPSSGLSWTAEQPAAKCTEALGFRSAPGGVHLSKTMMLAELTAVMDAISGGRSPAEAVLSDNVLGKATGAARRLALSRLNTLYGILTPQPIQAVKLKLKLPRFRGVVVGLCDYGSAVASSNAAS